MIEIKGLSKSFKNQSVLKDIDLTIPDKTIFGLIGINGAGKSTFLRILSGIFEQDSGTVKVDGEDAYDNENVKRKIFFLSDDPYYSARTTPVELLNLMKTFYHVNEVTFFEALDYFKIPVHKKMDKFSKGMKRQVFICLAFAIRPKYMLLDESFDGLDPLARIRFKEEIRNLVSETGATVIISSHSLKDLEDMCDSFAMLNHNNIVASGSIESVKNILHKYQIAFRDEIDIHLFPRIFKTIHKDGRVIRIVSDLTLPEIKKELESIDPLFIDELPIEFEEMFSAIVKDGGLV